jgi:hypothetical protein
MSIDIQIVKFAVSKDGKIVRMGTCPAFALDGQALAGESVVQLVEEDGTVDYDTHWVDMVVVRDPKKPFDPLQTDPKAPALVQRTAHTPTVTGTTISNIHLPATITIENRTYDVTESFVELTFTFAGTYPVKVDQLHHFPVTLMVTQ